MNLEQENFSVANPQTETLKAKVRPLLGLVAFFAVAGLQLLGNPFLYSFNYLYNIISIIILSLGSAILFALSLYLTERLIVQDKIKVWKILVISFICALLFGFVYFSSLYFNLQTIGPSEGWEGVIGFFIGIAFTIISLFVFFIANLFFYKSYKKINSKLYSLLFMGSLIFFLAMVGLRTFYYYDCEFGKNADCVASKAVKANNADLCEKNKYANPHQRNECYFKIGVKEKDLSICEKIVNDGGNGDAMKTSCVANVAFNTNNPSLCDSLKMKGGIWKDKCYVTFSSESIDSAVCDRVFDEYAKSQCLANVAINTNNGNYCQNVELQPEFRDYCLSDFNRKAKNISWDLGISGADAVMPYENVEGKTKDIQTQEKLYPDTSNWYGAAAGKLKFKHPPDWKWDPILETDGGIVVTSKDNTMSLYMYPKISFDRGLEAYDVVEKSITIAGKKFVYKDYYIKKGYDKTGYYALSIIKPVDYESISWSSDGRVEFRVKEPLKEKPSILDQIIFTFDFS